MYPNYNICHCFNFSVYNGYNWISVKNEDKISSCNPQNYNPLNLLLSHEKKNLCSCNPSLKEFFKKTKKTIILENLDLIKKLEEKINNLKNENNSLSKEKRELKTLIDKLKNKEFEQKYEINELQKEIAELNNIINNLEENKEKNNNKINDLKKIIEKEKKEIEELNSALQIALKGNDIIDNLGENYQYKQNLIKIDPKTGKFIGNKEAKDEINPIMFYDAIVEIKSIKDIMKGWEIKFSERITKNYEKFIKEKVLKIGVIGNSNKGKSFILSKISKINLPSGTSIKTEGLSVKYPDIEIYKDRIIALLDSAGLETPVLKDEDQNKFEATNLGEQEGKKDDNKEKDENDKNDKNENKDLFKEKSREKIITELFLQNYIIHNSDILIIVVGILTYSEQKLLNRIKREMKRLKINKTLYIIHNLMTYTTIKQVEDYINNTLLKSATFTLEKKINITTKLRRESGVCYYEKSNNNQKIFHLIFANEGSEAGDYYNNYTLKYLEETYTQITEIIPFDVKETIKKRFKDISHEIIEKIDENIEFDESNTNIIKLKKPANIILKKCLIDELGFSNLKANDFEPTYNYYKKGDKLIIRIEAPGNCDLESTCESIGEYIVIKITGNKKKDKEPEKLKDNIYTSREIGDFSLDIPLKSEEFLIKNDEPEIKNIKGLFIITYQLEQKNKTGKYVQRRRK